MLPSPTDSEPRPNLSRAASGSVRGKSLPVLQSTVNRRHFLKASVAATSVSAGLAGVSNALAAATQEETGCGVFRDKQKSFDTPIKRQARQDYEQNFQQWGGRLSNPINELFCQIKKATTPTFDFLVIGSGYGASILATRLSAQARENTSVAIFERGREWVTGTFPDRFRDCSRQTREVLFGPKKQQLQNPLGLYDVRTNDEVDVLVGSGLGGTSLINANIALRPQAELFQQPQWPQRLRSFEGLMPYYDLADLSLGICSDPDLSTNKAIAQQQIAARLCTRNEATPLSVVLKRSMLDANFRNRHGLLQRPCTLCGDCITGCNVGAKGTLATSYLPRAKQNGTQMYTQMEVRYLERFQMGWRVHFTYWNDTGTKIQPVNGCVTAANVILGAGSMGTTEILLRSRQQGLSVSCQLGRKWSTNGDGLGFLKKAKTSPNSVGYGAFCTDQAPVGPTVETTSFVNEFGPLDRRLLIQDGAVPRAMANFFGLLFGNADLDNTMVMLAVGHDDSSGSIRLEGNRASVRWPGLKDSDHRRYIQDTISRFAKAHGADYRVVKAFGDRLATVHPLGGCAMADSADCGVVNDAGQVYSIQGGEGVDLDDQGNPIHQGLYIADGSTLPRSIGVNPYMTICALSERIAHVMTHDPKMASYLKPWTS